MCINSEVSVCVGNQMDLVSMTYVCRRILRVAPPMPSSFSPIVKDFINRLLAKDPKRRMGVDDVKTHSFFQACHLIDTDLVYTQLSCRHYHFSILEVTFR